MIASFWEFMTKRFVHTKNVLTIDINEAILTIDKGLRSYLFEGRAKRFAHMRGKYEKTTLNGN